MPDPAPPVEVHRLATRVVSAHSLVLADRELVSVVSGDDKVVNANVRELFDGAGEVADDGIHHLAGEEIAVDLPDKVNLVMYQFS